VADLTIHTYTAAEGGLFVNSYLLETPAGVVVVDTNLLVSDITALKARLAALHKPLLGVFITHAHPDHFNGCRSAAGSSRSRRTSWRAWRRRPP
jgi:glyoxylase-like metal-dependent hydrolase (beta-lactamase superfamily II)